MINTINRSDISETPLVSVVVITYNSEQYVLETLESIKSQTYFNLELIISDDASKDKTVNICREWLLVNQKRFVKTELITVEYNTGIPANLNRALRGAQGEWIKGIAGDDLLLKDCIENNVNYIQASNENIYFLFSDVEVFKNEYNLGNIISWKSYNSEFFLKDFKEQYSDLVCGGYMYVPAPTSFMKNEALKRVDYFNEKYRFEDDFPMWIKLTHLGYKLFFMNRKTVAYRITDSSLSLAKPKPAYIECRFAVFRDLQFPYLIKKNPFIAYNIYLELTLLKLWNLRNHWYVRMIYLTSPYSIYKKTRYLFSRIF